MNLPVFDRVWRQKCSILPCSISSVKPFIRAHYLRKRPAIVTLTLAMMHGPLPVGTIVFADAPHETSKRYGGPTWELARLFINDDIPRNAESWFIAKAVDHIRRFHPQIAFLVSYADPSVGHQGTVYKAANWRGDGRTDDDRKSPRVDYIDARTGKKYARRKHLSAEAVVERVARCSKFRFVYPIGRPALRRVA